MASDVTIWMKTAWAYVRRALHTAYRRYRARQRMAMFSRPAVREMIEKAAAIEPMIHLPRGTRKVSWPPRVHDCRTLFRKGRRLQQRLGPAAREVVILIAGDSTGPLPWALLQALIESHAMDGAAVRPLVVSTDASPRRADGWRSDGRAEWFDFAAEVPPRIRDKFRRLLLLDMLGGVRARRIICIDSGLCRELLAEHARQLAAWTDVYALLDDRTAKGADGLYPESVTLIPYLRGAFCLSAAEKKSFVRRSLLPPRMEERLLVIDGLAEERAMDRGRDPEMARLLAAFLSRTRTHARI